MRISDWSSDVCSSDLVGVGERPVPRPLPHVDHADPGPGIAQGGCGGKPKPRAAARNDDSASFDLHGATPSFSIKSFVIRRLAHQRSKADRSEENTSELQSLMRTSYAVFCLKTNN